LGTALRLDVEAGAELSVTDSNSSFAACASGGSRSLKNIENTLAIDGEIDERQIARTVRGIYRRHKPRCECRRLLAP